MGYNDPGISHTNDCHRCRQYSQYWRHHPNLFIGREITSFERHIKAGTGGGTLFVGFIIYTTYRFAKSDSNSFRSIRINTDMSETDEPTEWFTVAEACSYLRVSNTTLYEYMKTKRLPFFYLAGTRNRRLKKHDLDALLEPGDPDESH